MERLSLDLPSLYGDHHVLEVRQILLDLPGTDEVYASSCFHVVDITYDPAKLDEDTIRNRLEGAGYLSDLQTPSETGSPAYGTENGGRYFRHTATYEQTNKVIGFSQNVMNEGRALWPCPGMGVISSEAEGE